MRKLGMWKWKVLGYAREVWLVVRIFEKLKFEQVEQLKILLNLQGSNLSSTQTICRFFSI
jgi:hypothetical protein